MVAVNTGLIELDPATVAAMIESGEAVLVDVREAHEWAVERIAGSVWYPMSAFDLETFPVFPGQKVILTCLKGARSATVAGKLLGAGRPWMIHLKGGLIAWEDAGLPLDEAE
jgi:rhodanese-related sulfurtransferase